MGGVAFSPQRNNLNLDVKRSCVVALKFRLLVHLKKYSRAGAGAGAGAQT